MVLRFGRIYVFFSVFLGKRTAWMFGKTPPWAMVTPDRSLFNSSSFDISYGQLKMSWDNSAFLVVSGSVTGQLEDFSRQILENCCQVDWGTSTNSLSVVAFPQQTVNTTDWELKSCSWWTSLWFGSLSLAFATSRHLSVVLLFLRSLLRK